MRKAVLQMLIFEICLYVAVIAMLLYYPVKAMFQGGSYSYAIQPDETEKVFKLVE